MASKSHVVLQKIGSAVLTGFQLSAIRDDDQDHIASSVVPFESVEGVLFRGSVLGEPAGSVVSRKYLIAAAALMRYVYAAISAVVI